VNYCANHDAATKSLQCRNKATPGHIYCPRCRAEAGGYVPLLLKPTTANIDSRLSLSNSSTGD
jgi:hypothetical protein